MEIFAQWLDDLDDLILALPFVWARARVACLRLGLIAALSQAVADLLHAPLVWASSLATIALVCVMGWFMAIAAARLGRLPSTQRA